MKRLIQMTLVLMLALAGLSPALPSYARPAAQAGPTPAVPPNAGAPPAGAPAAATQAATAAGGPAVSYHAVTGKVRFMSAPAGQALSAAPGFIAGQDTPEQAARAFLDQFAGDFGLRNPAAELQTERVRELEPGLEAVRFQQVYRGVPVFGGQLTVQVDSAGAARAAIGEAAPEINIPVQPQISAAAAAAAAIAYVAKHEGDDPATLSAAAPALWIYNPALLDFRGLNANRLVWRTEVTSSQRANLRELTLVDASTGGVALSFNQVDDALNRRIYNNNNNPALGLPGAGPVRTEGGPATGNADADNAYDFGGATYDYYRTVHGRDSYDDAGATLVQTVNYCPSAASCPYFNANWNGTQMLYGQNYASGDDIVAHELTHAVTQYESGLFYWMQSGAINEAFSDIWGEIIDLQFTNGSDDDSAGVRWQMGEDLPIGAIRNMAAPGPFGNPDRMTSTDFSCSTADRGGVHDNSGVANKAAVLMVDGGVFNGFTVGAIGANKTARIFYRAQVGLLNAASDYLDLNDALAYACTSLVGKNGITASDCDNVRKALAAVEMGKQPTNCAVPDARWCEVPDFTSTFNGSSTGWTEVIGDWTTDISVLKAEGVANKFISIRRGTAYRDFTLRTTMRRSGCTGCANGVFVRGKATPTDGTGNWASAYQFSYRNDGYYGVYRLDPSGSISALMSWTPTPLVNNGGWNTLQVEAEGSQMRFYLNDTLVWSGINTRAQENSVGLMMYSNLSGGGNLLEVDSAAVSGGTPTILYREAFDGNLGGWAPTAATGLTNFDLFEGYATSGSFSVYGPNEDFTTDYRLTGPSIRLPGGMKSFLRFNHYFAVENGFDGGVVEYSRNGGAWTDAGALFTDAGYTGALGGSGPLTGRQAFTGAYRGYLSSRADLSPLAGGDVRFRFRFASDSNTFDDGWFIDDPTVYTCSRWTVGLPLSRR